MSLVESVSNRISMNPFLTVLDVILASSSETINFERCYWTSEGALDGIRGSTQTAGGLFNHEFHIHAKLGLWAHDCLIAVMVRRENTGPWSEIHIAMDASAPLPVHELFAALLGHVSLAAMEFRFSAIAKLLLSGRHEDDGYSFAHIIHAARARLG